MASDYIYFEKLLSPQQKASFKTMEDTLLPYKILKIDHNNNAIYEAHGRRWMMSPSGYSIESQLPGETRYQETQPRQIQGPLHIGDIFKPKKEKEEKKKKKEEKSTDWWKQEEWWKDWKPEKEEKGGGVKKYEYTSYADPNWGKTVCQLHPNCCQPREIKMVAFDADQTLLDINGIATSVTGPLKKIDDNTVVELYDKETPQEIKYYPRPSSFEYPYDEGFEEIEKEMLGPFQSEKVGEVDLSKKENYRTVIKLKPTTRETLDELDKRGIKATVISLNSPGSVKRILKEFGIADHFVDIRDSWDNKGRVFAEQAEKIGVCPCNALMVDDRKEHVKDIADACGMGLQIGKDKDISELIQIFNYIKNV